MYLITNGRLITRDPANPYFEDGGVAVEGSTIVEVGDDLTLKLKYPNAEIIDAGGNVIMPAFINAHTHIYSALARGLSMSGLRREPVHESAWMEGSILLCGRHVGRHLWHNRLYKYALYYRKQMRERKKR